MIKRRYVAMCMALLVGSMYATAADVSWSWQKHAQRGAGAFVGALCAGLIAGWIDGSMPKATVDASLERLARVSAVVCCVGVGALLSIDGAVHTAAAGSLYLQEKYEQYVVKQLVDEVIVLSLTPNVSIRSLPPQQCEERLKSKARLIVLRKSILWWLEREIDLGRLSRGHVKALESKMSWVKKAFAAVDFIREENPYEKSFCPNWIDRWIVSTVVDSIILSCKPMAECTHEERIAKEKHEQRRVRIREKVLKRACSTWIEKGNNKIDFFVDLAMEFLAGF